MVNRVTIFVCCWFCLRGLGRTQMLCCQDLTTNQPSITSKEGYGSLTAHFVTDMRLCNSTPCRRDSKKKNLRYTAQELTVGQALGTWRHAERRRSPPIETDAKCMQRYTWPGRAPHACLRCGCTLESRLPSVRHRARHAAAHMCATGRPRGGREGEAGRPGSVPGYLAAIESECVQMQRALAAGRSTRLHQSDEHVM